MKGSATADSADLQINVMSRIVSQDPGTWISFLLFDSFDSNASSPSFNLCLFFTRQDSNASLSAGEFLSAATRETVAVQRARRDTKTMKFNKQEASADTSHHPQTVTTFPPELL